MRATRATTGAARISALPHRNQTYDTAKIIAKMNMTTTKRMMSRPDAPIRPRFVFIIETFLWILQKDYAEKAPPGRVAQS
jgi:hypothetical protein